MQRRPILEDVDAFEAGGQKSRRFRSDFGPEFFLQETSVRFGCQMFFPPFTVEEWIRIVDWFQIFLPGIFASLRIDFSWCPRASPNRCVIIGNASSGGQQSL